MPQPNARTRPVHLSNTWERGTPGQLESLPDPRGDGHVELIELAERQTWLYRALGDLPCKQREAVELMKIRGLSVAAAAVASGQSAGAIKVNMHRAQRALRARYRRESKGMLNSADISSRPASRPHPSMV